MLPIFLMGCTGEFGCDCSSKRLMYSGHGSRAKYQRGCRCIRCTEANSKYTKEYRELKRGRA